MESIRLLLVEDNPADALCLKDALSETPQVNFAVSHVETLAEAVACLEEERFDVLVLDLGLPDSQGLMALISMRGQRSDNG